MRTNEDKRVQVFGEETYLQDRSGSYKDILVTNAWNHRRDMWTLQKLKGKEGGSGEMVKKKGGKERSRRRHQDESEEECWSGTERRARLVTRSLHRREWGWSEDERSVRLDQPGSSWVRHGKTFEDTFENPRWREDVQAGVGPDPQAGRCWVQLGQPPMLSYLSISTGESWRERAGT